MLVELRQTFRSLLRKPASNLFVIVILALGVGANTGAFSAMYALLLKPLPYPEPQRLVELTRPPSTVNHEASLWPICSIGVPVSIFRSDGRLPAPELGLTLRRQRRGDGCPDRHGHGRFFPGHWRRACVAVPLPKMRRSPAPPSSSSRIVCGASCSRPTQAWSGASSTERGAVYDRRRHASRFRI